MLLRGQRKKPRKEICTLSSSVKFSPLQKQQLDIWSCNLPRLCSFRSDRQYQSLGFSNSLAQRRGPRVGTCPLHRASWGLKNPKLSKQIKLKSDNQSTGTITPSTQVKASCWDIWHLLHLIKANKGCAAAKLTKGFCFINFPGHQWKPGALACNKVRGF